MIRAVATDQPAIEAFLAKHIETSMFPLVNLINHGMSGGHPRAVTCWIRWKAGQITDVLTVSDEGMIFPQCPTGPWGDVVTVLSDIGIKGILGAADQVASLRGTLRLPASPDLDVVEPLYHLSLMNLQIPDGLTELRQLQDAPRDLIEGWRAAYNIELLAYPKDSAAAQAARDIAGYIAKDSHRVLMQDGKPVAMTGFNAELPHVVQIGGVYTPPEARSGGLARRAVALHLAEAAEKGVTDALLFAANPAAEKAYQAIGFAHIGHYAIAMYEEPQVRRD
ncbi:GNAT family N-acetyltransferase [Yoonia sp. SS1-5]|uniref:GNAT family N-acetyltransferase n=1 Tax=Yoonia rhodophyticola TaxID=3137370 RepID=A0AAN0MFK1_9RHOB